MQREVTATSSMPDIYRRLFTARLPYDTTRLYFFAGSLEGGTMFFSRM